MHQENFDGRTVDKNSEQNLTVGGGEGGGLAEERDGLVGRGDDELVPADSDVDRRIVNKLESELEIVDSTF